MPHLDTLPAVLAGPLLRRLEPRRLVLWLVGSRALTLTLTLHLPTQTREITLDHCQVVPVGRQAFIHLIDVSLDDALPLDVEISYDLLCDDGGIADWAPHLLYANAQLPSFVLHGRIHQLVHGSCRKPHTAPTKACCASTACWPTPRPRPTAQPC